jgi:hypothetical protein
VRGREARLPNDSVVTGRTQPSAEVAQHLVAQEPPHLPGPEASRVIRRGGIRSRMASSGRGSGGRRSPKLRVQVRRRLAAGGLEGGGFELSVPGGDAPADCPLAAALLAVALCPTDTLAAVLLSRLPPVFHDSSLEPGTPDINAYPWCPNYAIAHVRATRRVRPAHRVTGTGSSNPFPSSGESANCQSLFGNRGQREA